MAINQTPKINMAANPRLSRYLPNRGLTKPASAPLQPNKPAPVHKSVFHGGAGGPQYGSAPRNQTSQGIHAVTHASVARAATGTLFPRPPANNFRQSTQVPGATQPLRTAAVDMHAGTQTGTTKMDFWGPKPGAIMLGDPRQIGRDTAGKRVAVHSNPLGGHGVPFMHQKRG